MFYVLGLGNPEEKYQDTPHNIGMQMINKIVKNSPYDISNLEINGKRNAKIAYGDFDGQVFQLIQPLTYMNNSGDVLKELETKPEQVVVIYDDIDLPFGSVRIARNRGTGGHNGLKSIEQVLNSSDFIRIRIGVCPVDWFGNMRKPKGKQAVNNYLVYKKLPTRKLEKYGIISKKIENLLRGLLSEGYQKTVSKQGRR